MGLYLQISPNNGYYSRKQYYCCVLPYIRRIVYLVNRDGSHPYAHWKTGMNNYWSHGISYKIGLITDYNYSIYNDKYP